MFVRLAIVAEGDANTRDCWSGCALGFVSAVRRAGHEVVAIDAELRGATRLAAAGLAFHPDLGKWKERFRLGPVPFRARSLIALRGLRHTLPCDAVVQVGATFLLPRASLQGAPYVVFCDSNIAQARRGSPWSSATNLTDAQTAEVTAREQAVYDSADRIWVWSENLGRSFRSDFGQPEEKIAIVGGGANRVPARPPAARPSPGIPPSVLFVGKEYERKGLPLLLEAFATARTVIPDAELHVVGCDPPGAKALGVFVHGFLSWSDPDQSAELERLYERATVFCMPSRYEPFGVVFAEAMLNALPCVGVNSWAMTEIIVPGETGWLVADGDAAALATVLAEALGDPERSARLGRNGRERATRLFTWDSVAARAVADLESHAAAGGTSR